MGDGTINHPLSQQVKMDEITKKVIPKFPMPTLQKETQKRSVVFTRENTDCVFKSINWTLLCNPSKHMTS